jgi:hypothetical protein
VEEKVLIIVIYPKKWAFCFVYENSNHIWQTKNKQEAVVKIMGINVAVFSHPSM